VQEALPLEERPALSHSVSRLWIVEGR
jgi:hypothetical protein